MFWLHLLHDTRKTIWLNRCGNLICLANELKNPQWLEWEFPGVPNPASSPLCFQIPCLSLQEQLDNGLFACESYQERRNFHTRDKKRWPYFHHKKKLVIRPSVILLQCFICYKTRNCKPNLSPQVSGLPWIWREPLVIQSVYLQPYLNSAVQVFSEPCVLL